MAFAVGREAILYKNGVAIAGIRATSVKFSAEPIDWSSRDSGAAVVYSDKSASAQCTIEVEGITFDAVLRSIWDSSETSKLLTDMTYKYVNGQSSADTITCNFFMNSYEEAAPHDGEATYTGTFTTSGPWTVG